MIMSMYNSMKVLCITNRHLAVQDYFAQIEQIAKAAPEAVIVREKDLPEAEYEQLAARVMQICRRYQVPCILHTYVQAALRLGADAVHLPLQGLLALSEEEKRRFALIGASTHSIEEAQTAQAAGASYITAGHIYATDCKKGLPPRGISFLKEVCAAVDIPVYALGGINASNAAECIRAGAHGVCVMSACMKHMDIRRALDGFQM